MESIKKYPISRYLNVRSAYFPSFAPDGQDIAFLTDVTGVAEVWQVGAPVKAGEVLWPDQLTFGAERVMGAWFSPLPGDGRLIYARDTGGNENAQLVLLQANSAQEIELTQGYEQAMHTFGEWSADGQQIIFAANRRHPGIFDLYVQRLDDQRLDGDNHDGGDKGEARLIWENDTPGFLYNMSFSPDSRHVVVTRMSSSFSHDLIEVELLSATARVITPPSEQGAQTRFDAAHYASDGRSLYMLTDLNSDFLYIARLYLDTRVIEPLVAPEWDIDLLAMSPDRRRLAYTTNVDGVSALYLLDLVTQETREAPGLGASPGVIGMMDSLLTFSADSSRLAFSYTSANRASNVFVWDLVSDELLTVTRSSHGGLRVDSFVAPQLVHYPTFDRDETGSARLIPAWFYKPHGYDDDEAGQAPAIVIAHGGPEAQFRPYFHFFAQYFVSNGYAVLAPNVRGSTGYGKAYSHLDDVRKRMDSVSDLAHAAYWLKEQPDVDGDRLVVYGGSYGGFMVLSVMVTYPDLWAAGVDIVGVSNFVTFLENTSEYRRAHREAEYGSLEHDREFLESISPSNHVDNITAPLMVIHGANDPRVPLTEAEQIVKALRAKGVGVESLVFPDEGHGLAKLKNKLAAYPDIVNFLGRVLG